MDRSASAVQSLVEQDRAFDAQVVDRIMGRDVTRADLSAAFNRVADRSNWKLPIVTEISISSDFEMETIRRAVEFFTASRATFTPVRVLRACVPGVMLYRVEAAGYYAAVGA